MIDEASMMSMQDLADIIGHAAGRGGKVIVAGDQEQLTAVEGGGAMMLLARHLGHVQLAEAVRFQAGWEQQASLRLRAGDLSALDAYDINGRIRGGEPDQIMDEARKTYVAHYLAGTDVELIAWERGRCREMSRRIRDDLIHLGQVERGREVTLADGARASAGDLIICRQNDHNLEAGEAGRTLANGDVLRIEAISGDGSVTVRRATDRDPTTGQRRWTEQAFAYRGYGTADLGYAVTGHAAQGRTVTVAIPLVTGGESRQWLYSAMTRGAVANIAHVFTRPAKLPDPQPGTRPAPELARHDRLQRERDGLPADPTQPAHRPDPREPIAVLADVLERDGSQMSALQTQRRNLLNADHLAILNAQWQDQTTRLHAGRYRQVIRAALPSGYEAEKLDSSQATWLWRTMRAAEAAGLDIAAVAGRAICGRSLTGARDIASVINARIRREAGPMVPVAPRPWSEQVPIAGDPDLRRYLTELARAMDERKARIGEFAAEHAPPWAVHALGPVPGEPLARLDWQQRAAHVGAYRELYGWNHDTDPIGPEPAGDSPDKRAAWHTAAAAINRTDDAGLRALPDGSLWHIRDTYRAETQWAPPHVGAELRQVRIAAHDQAAAAARADAEAAAARERGEHQRAGRHELLARSARAAGQFYRQREQTDAGLMDDRQEWARITEGFRHLAIAADSELRRRHPGQFLAPLRSAEPPPPQDELPPIPADCAETARWISTMAEQRAAFQARIEERRGVMVPSEDPDYEPEGEAWPSRPPRDREAILQPPKPDLRPSPRMIERAADRQAAP